MAPLEGWRETTQRLEFESIKMWFPKSFRLLLGDPQGQVDTAASHLTMRRNMATAFSPDAMAQYLPRIETRIQRYLQQWSGEEYQVQGMDVQPQLEELTFGFAAELIVGLEVDAATEKQLVQLYTTFSNGLVWCVWGCVGGAHVWTLCRMYHTVYHAYHTVLLCIRIVCVPTNNKDSKHASGIHAHVHHKYTTCTSHAHHTCITPIDPVSPCFNPPTPHTHPHTSTSPTQFSLPLKYPGSPLYKAQEARDELIAIIAANIKTVRDNMQVIDASGRHNVLYYNLQTLYVGGIVGGDCGVGFIVCWCGCIVCMDIVLLLFCIYTLLFCRYTLLFCRYTLLFLYLDPTPPLYSMPIHIIKRTSHTHITISIISTHPPPHTVPLTALKSKSTAFCNSS